MQKRKVTLLVIAGLVALMTVFVARALMNPQQETAVAPVVQTTEILAATHDLPVGSILKDMDIKWIPWAADADLSQFYVKGKNDSAQFVGAVLRDGMRSGEPFLSGHIVQPHDHGFLAAVLEPGKRATSIVLSPAADVAGFIFPGDHVDVILTHSFSRKDSNDFTERRVSETVIADVRVLALDQKSDSMSADPKVAQIATLEVTQKQAEKLALASDLVGPPGSGSKGSLSLVLRALASGEDTAAPDALKPLNATTLAPPPKADTTTWDSDVSPAFPGVGGDDSLMQRVHIMRGKEATDTSFERHK
ncbi:MAG TPA: Flp pilus assembly protein CpaB [Alphaproteobacteria bacterium]|nr:Flp pilus assembly protein CpaB [Alphaproteobacteria bacterium]